MTIPQALIFANGDPADGSMVHRTLSNVRQPYVIAADGGVRVAKYFGVDIHTVIGDMDSIAPDDYQRLKNAGTTFIQHPPQKDFTDLELALLHAVEKDISWMRIIGGIGGRFDQTLANVYLLALPKLVGRDVGLVAGEQSMRLLYSGVHHIEGQVGDTLSLIPLGGAVKKIRTDGLQYPLKDETLYFGPARGVSNVFLFPTVTLHIGAGQLLVIHTNGRA